MAPSTTTFRTPLPPPRHGTPPALLNILKIKKSDRKIQNMRLGAAKTRNHQCYQFQTFKIWCIGPFKGPIARHVISYGFILSRMEKQIRTFFACG